MSHPHPVVRLAGKHRRNARLPRSYVKFLGGLFAARLGDGLYTFAIPWIAYEWTGSAWVMSSLYAVQVLPVILFAPVAGTVADRRDRRRLMIEANLARAGLVCLIPFLYGLGVLELWQLYGMTLLMAALSLLVDVSAVAAIPHIAGAELTRANARYQLVNQLADLSGPLLAGFVIAAADGMLALGLVAIAFLAAPGALWRMPQIMPDRGPNAATRLLTGLMEGFRYLIRDRLNLFLSMQAMLGNFGYFVAFASLMYYLRSTLHLDAEQIGLNFTLLGAGGILGSLVAVPLARRIRRGILIPLLLGVGAAGFGYASVSSYWLAPGIAFGIVTACNTAWNAVVQSIRQETVPDGMLGRVLGFSRMFTRLAMPLGALVSGWITAWEPVFVFVAAALAKALEVMIALAAPIRRL